MGKNGWRGDGSPDEVKKAFGYAVCRFAGYLLGDDREDECGKGIRGELSFDDSERGDSMSHARIS